MQNITKVKSAHLKQKKHGGGGGGSKRRWGAGRRGRGKNNKSGNGTAAAAAAGDGGGGSTEESAPDLFDDWLGAKLTAWSQGRATPAGGTALARPPEGSGVTEDIDFDPSKDEIGEGDEARRGRWVYCTLGV